MEEKVNYQDEIVQENNEETNRKQLKLDETLDDMSKTIILKILIILSVASMLQLSAFNAFANLQSSLNTAGGLGTTGLALHFAVMVMTSLFLTPITVERNSTKWIMILSMFTYIIYMATGFYPSWYTVIPASVIIGIGTAHFWLAVPAYVIDIAKRYAYITDTVIQDRVTLFLNIIYGFIYPSNVWGNLFSSLVFQHKDTNSTSENFEDFCGPNFCPYRELNMSLIIPPTQKQIRKVAVHLIRSRDRQLLIISSVFSGMAMGFVMGDFTIAYISCPSGIQNVGLVMLTFGVSQSLFSAGFGKLNKYTGHLAIYTFGSITLTSAYVTLLLWNPLQTQCAVVYVLAGLIGLAGAANEPVVSTLHNLYFDKTRDIALSSYRLLCLIGWTISFGYSSWLCSRFKLYILIVMLVLSLITLIVLDIKHKRELRQTVDLNDKVGEILS